MATKPETDFFAKPPEEEHEKMDRIIFTLPLATKTAFMKKCEDHKIDMSTVLRRFVEAQLK